MHESHLFFKSFISFLFSQEFFKHENCRNFRCIKSLSFSNVKYKILQLVRSQNNAENSQTSSAVIFFSFVPRWRRIQNKYKRLAKYSWVCVWACILHQMHICTLTQLHVWRGALSRHGARTLGLGSTHRSLVTQAWGSCAMRWPVTTKFHETHYLEKVS